MSAIAGIIRFDGREADNEHLAAMTACMANRAPDGITHWHASGAALGLGLLRTTPESLEETQPLPDDGGSLVLVMDGRVDNWEELRAELLENGRTLRTRSDAELVLRAFETWGEHCLDHIDGDFAVVIWNANTRRAFCARDRFGVKPFYYHFDGKVFSFASELRPLLDLPWVPKSFNHGMAAEFLGAEWTSVEETFWSGIQRLPPNTRMTVGAGTRSLATYWHPDITVHDPPLSDEDHVSRYRELLTDGVRRLSRSHRPVACEVSGGLDSSAVFALAEHLRRDGKLPAPGLRGYTLHFDPATTANDLPFARAVGEKLGVKIEEVAPTETSLAGSIEACSADAEFPPYPNGVMGFAIRDEASRAGCRVMLGGNGADEQIYGSRTYYGDAIRAGSFRTLFAWLTEDGRSSGWPRAVYWLFRYGLYQVLPEVLRAKARRAFRALSPGGTYRSSSLLTSETLGMLAGRPSGWPAVDPMLAALMERSETLRLLLMPYSIFCVEHEACYSERRGVEMRHPFLWRPLVEFLLRLPPRQKLRGPFNKHIHRQALADVLPREVLQRTDKADFTVTFARHIPALLQHLRQSPDAGSGGWVSPENIETLGRDAGRPDYGGWPQFMLWTLFGCTCLKTLEKHLTKR